MKKITFLIRKSLQDVLFNQENINELRVLGEVHVYDKDDFSDESYVLSFVKDSSVIVTSWYTPMIDNQILDVCPDLIGVVHAAGSVKDVIGDDYIRCGLPVASAANEMSRGVAETTLGIAIAACKGFFRLVDEARAGMWRENYASVKDFCDIKIGVIGAGIAGKYFIKLLDNFCVEVLVYDPYLSDDEITLLGAQKCDLSELMAESDIISIHAPSIPETDNMINKKNLALMKDGSVLINTARGSLINEADLIAECKKRNITAVLDVTNPEPPEKDSELRTLPNIYLLQHVAGAATNGKKRIGKHVCKEISRLLNGEPLECGIETSKLSVMA